MTEAIQQRPAWYKRRLMWVAVVVVAVLAVLGVREVRNGPPRIAYGDFFNQLAADNIASVTFSGTQIDGKFKAPVKEKAANNASAPTAFRSQVPDWGDPALLSQLRKDHVSIAVTSSSAYWWGTSAVLGGLLALLLAKPMLLIVAAAFVAGLIRVARGGKMNMRATLAVLPMFRSFAADAEKSKPSPQRSPAQADPATPEEEMTDAAQHNGKRAWYLRLPVWLAAIVIVALAAFGMVEMNKGPAAISYSDFFNQLDAGNVASVSLSGTQIDGKFKQPVKETSVNGAAPQAAFRSQAPSFGDPALLPDLRQHQVAVDVVSSSSWLSWLARMPWPMVLIVAALLIAGFVNFRRSDKAAGSAVSNNPMLGMVAGLFGKK